MYRLINLHSVELFARVERSDLDPYLWMIQQLSECDVSIDQEF